MTPTILRSQWERYEDHVFVSSENIKKFLKSHINCEITDIGLMPEGCANTNYKICFNRHEPVILRIYTRDSASMLREAALYRELAGLVPVPMVIALDNSHRYVKYSWAIYSFIAGISMRDAILSGDDEIITQCCLDAGKYAAILSNIKYSQGGFFDHNLNIKIFKQKYLDYFLIQLEDRNIKRELNKDIITKIYEILDQEHLKYLPDIHKANLTHGDYDPANIKVAKTDNRWVVTGILDWEFAHAGSYFLDIGKMLRYSDKLPLCFEQAFILGLKNHGANIPKDYKYHAKLIDLLSLLQLIRFNPKNLSPRLNNDVTILIYETVNFLGSQKMISSLTI